ncbi:hypothetical protein [Paenibacillus gansuensis]|uniref:Potassium/proton antiporter subunit KhtT-like N-terminal domain-containing protein n=1 Tax=Paenibacillus gansuensis TaxID=306542 RepID=A0ABW5P8I5_9BACL
MKIKMSDLPGLGKRISMTMANDSRFVLIVHHTGVRELYYFDEDEDEECIHHMLAHSDNYDS